MYKCVSCYRETNIATGVCVIRGTLGEMDPLKKKPLAFVCLAATRNFGNELGFPVTQDLLRDDLIYAYQSWSDIEVDHIEVSAPANSVYADIWYVENGQEGFQRRYCFRTSCLRALYESERDHYDNPERR